MAGTDTKPLIERMDARLSCQYYRVHYADIVETLIL